MNGPRQGRGRSHPVARSEPGDLPPMAWDRVVDDVDDAEVAPFVGLRDRPLRDQPQASAPNGRFLAEGDVVAARALAAGYRLLALLVDAQRVVPLPGAVRRARLEGARVLGAGPGLLRAITGASSHGGSLGVFARPAPRAPSEVLAGRRTVVVTEGVANPVNLGLIARSAVAMGAEALLVDPASADPFYRRASRVSMGEVFAVPHARLDALPGGLDPLRNAGFTLLALTPATDALDIGALRAGDDDPVALLVGAEGPGLSSAVLGAADLRVRIPLSGGVDSLNVGAAAAVAAYALGRARGC
ncbi:MAG: RNA methyltransferase [Microthrixaceae bacterium]